VTDEDRRHLATLREQIDAELDRIFSGQRRVAILGYPFDGNVGNHMMWVAIDRFLRARGIAISYTAHMQNTSVDDLRRAIGDDPIVFLGGVTMSRLWPDHPRLRREIARAFPDNLLVSLPSTIIWVDDADERDGADMFGDHERVIVLARSTSCAANARRVLPARVDVRAVPDSAFCLPGQIRRSAPQVPVLWQVRDDHEGVGFVPPSGIEVFDWAWLGEESRLAYVALRGSGILSRARHHGPAALTRPLSAGIAQSYSLASRLLLRSGGMQLDRGRVLVTDRMHPHVLAALRGQQVVLLPDRFGKNRSVYDDSTHPLSTVHWADTADEALDTAMRLATGG